MKSELVPTNQAKPTFCPWVVLLEKKLRELVEAATPCLPLVSCLRRNIVVSVHARSLELLSNDLRIVTVARSLDLTATEADENKLVGISEALCLICLLNRDHSAAEDSERD